MKIRAFKSKTLFGTNFVVYSDEGMPAKSVTVEMNKDFAEGEIIHPSFTLNDADCQTLMDDLHAAGFRASDQRDGSGEIQRLNNHLQDMRHIAFKGKPPE